MIPQCDRCGCDIDGEPHTPGVETLCEACCPRCAVIDMLGLIVGTHETWTRTIHIVDVIAALADAIEDGTVDVSAVRW